MFKPPKNLRVQSKQLLYMEIPVHTKGFQISIINETWLSVPWQPMTREEVYSLMTELLEYLFGQEPHALEI